MKRSSSLWAPTVLIFLAGTIKYLERVLSLFHGRLMNSSKQLEEYASFLEEYKLSDASPVSFNPFRYFYLEEETKKGMITKTKLPNVEMVRDAFYFFLSYVGLYTEEEIKDTKTKESRSYFLHRTPEDAFKVLEIQFNFAYQAFYTKTAVMHKTLWRVLRYIVLLFQVVSLVIWCLSKKYVYSNSVSNIRITYVLLIGSIAVEVFGLVRIHLSDWNMALLKKDRFGIRSWYYNGLLSAGNRTWGRYWIKKEALMRVLLRRAFYKRWSESVPQLNLINFCVDERFKIMQNVIEFLGLKDLLDEQRYVSYRMFSNQLRDFIYEYLSDSPLFVSFDPRWGGNFCFKSYLCHARGNWTPLMMGFPQLSLLPTSDFNNKDYLEILKLWHIITEMFYQVEIGISDKGPGVNIYREISKTLSDYMAYILVRQPAMLNVDTGEIRKGLTKAYDSIKEKHKEILRNPKEYMCMAHTKDKHMAKSKEDQYRRTCEIMGSIVMSPGTQEFVCLRIPSTFTEALKSLEKYGILKWEFLARMWMELLCYAALRCKPALHVVRLKRGGELLSFVWLLLHQFDFALSKARVSDAAAFEESFSKDPEWKDVAKRAYNAF